MATKVPLVSLLDDQTKAQYEEKLKIIGERDPFLIPKSEWSQNTDDFPAVTSPDIVSYLLHATSLYTLQDFQAYKSLEAYNQFVSGWIRDLSVKKIPNTTVSVMTAKVSETAKLCYR